MDSVDFLLLGNGYTTKRLKNRIASINPGASVHVTSRSGSPLVEFDLNDSSTWANLPRAEHTIWTFPAEPLQAVKEFADSYLDRLGRLVVIGSTSAFQVSEAGQWVNEESELDLSIERVQGECHLQNLGAMVVFSAGIYGEERNPLDWIKKGMVGKSSKYVNMIHVQDLVSVLLGAAQNGELGETYIASNNHPEMWKDVISKWEKRGLVSDVPEKTSQRPSKRIDASETLKSLAVDLKFRTFSDSVS